MLYLRFSSQNSNIHIALIFNLTPVPPTGKRWVSEHAQCSINHEVLWKNERYVQKLQLGCASKAKK
jgi:hypothetical protein